MIQLITQAAVRRMWHSMKSCNMTSGFCLFGKDGSGGWWYPYGNCPHKDLTDIEWPCDQNCNYGTLLEFSAEVFDFLEQRELEDEELAREQDECRLEGEK